MLVLFNDFSDLGWLFSACRLELCSLQACLPCFLTGISTTPNPLAHVITRRLPTSAHPRLNFGSGLLRSTRTVGYNLLTTPRYYARENHEN
jgi:hypothetical protein